MDEFDLDLRAIEDHLDDPEEEIETGEDIPDERTIELGVLDGSTDPEEWIEIVEQGRVLVLAIEGDLNQLAAGFAKDIYETGGELVHFRGFLLVTPPEIAVDTDRLD